MTVYLLLGGGTAGHVNPLLAVAEQLRKTEPNSEIIIVGTAEGLESRLVPERGFTLTTIERLPLPRKPSAYAFRFPARFRRAVRQLRRLIRSRSVDVVVGFGGYASAPGYLAARKERVPIVIHEANAKPGFANRMGARWTPFVGVTFASTRIANAHWVGMPLRQELLASASQERRAAARAQFQLEENRPTLLVTGGSQGALSLNRAVTAAAPAIIDAGWQILHIWGQLTEVDAPEREHHRVLRYCSEMDLALAVADFAVSRAGAATVSELSALGIPSVLVPYPVGNGEQRLNAEDVVHAGGAILVADHDLTGAWLGDVLVPLLCDADRRADMSQAALTVGSRDGTEKLLALVEEALASRATLKG